MGTSWIVEGLIVYIISTIMKFVFSTSKSEKQEIFKLTSFHIKKGNSDSIASVIQLYGLLVALEGILLNILDQYLLDIPKSVIYYSVILIPILIIALIIKLKD